MRDPSPTSARPPVTASDGHLELSATAQGTLLRVTFHNVGEAALTVRTQVQAESGSQFDWFELILSDNAGGARHFHFVADRNSSATIAKTLAPGQSEAVIIDLRAWALAPANGQGPIAPGQYRGTLIYDVRERGPWWSGRLELTGIVFDIP